MVAIYDYQGQFEDELSFSAGDKIQVTAESELFSLVHNMTMTPELT